MSPLPPLPLPQDLTTNPVQEAWIKTLLKIADKETDDIFDMANLIATCYKVGHALTAYLNRPECEAIYGIHTDTDKCIAAAMADWPNGENFYPSLPTSSSISPDQFSKALTGILENYAKDWDTTCRAAAILKERSDLLLHYLETDITEQIAELDEKRAALHKRGEALKTLNKALSNP